MTIIFTLSSYVMKKILTFALWAVVLAAFPACSQEQEEALLPLQLSYELQTRAADLELQSVQLVAGAQVGVTVSGAQVSYENQSWVADGLGVLSHTGNPLYFSNQNEVSVTAYAPYDGSWNQLPSGTNRFSVQAFQQSAEGYVQSDLLWAQTTAQPVGETVNLLFNHCLSKLDVLLLTSDGTLVDQADIRICGTCLQADICQGNATPVAGSEADILAAEQSAQASVVLIPQTLPAGTPFIKAVVEGKTLAYVLKTPLTLQPGERLTFRMQVNLHSSSTESFVLEEGVW